MGISERLRKYDGFYLYGRSYMLFIGYIVLGAVAGFTSGLLGVGGGLVIVPALTFLLSHYLKLSDNITLHLAIGTSLASIIITAGMSARGHHQRGVVIWPLVWRFAPGLIIGSLVLGPVLAVFLPVYVLRVIFASFCVWMSLQLLLTSKQPRDSVTDQHPHFFIPAVIIGALASIIGIAGGSLAAMVLSWYRYSMREIIGTTAAIGLPVAICGTIGFIITGWHQSGLPAWTSGYVYWPAFAGIAIGSSFANGFGVSLAHKIDVKHLKRIFAVLLLFIAIHMVWLN